MSPQWVQELLFICLFFSVWDLSPPLSVTLLRDEGNKSNQTVAWRKTLNCNNRLCALKNSRHQTAKAGVYSIFVPADSYVLVGVIFFPWRQRSILFGEARICQCKTCILAYSTCLGIFSRQKSCCIPCGCHFEQGYIQLSGPIACPFPHLSG